MIRKLHHLQRLITASAVAFLLGTSGSEALALALGKVTVLSALGEPLRAEIEIPEITPEEAASLRAGTATPDAFKAAGLEYNNIVSSFQVSLQKRADGRSYLRLVSERVINDPFIDLILEANWASGRIVRDYTMLFDPPSLRVAVAPALSAAQLATQASPTRPLPSPAATASPASRPAAPPAVVASPPPIKTAPPPKPAAAPAPAQPVQRVADAKQITVATGDTAVKIVLAAKPANLSLDQMLVALLRANPDAFVAGNVNRLKAGAVLDLPNAETASQVSVADAQQSIIAQSRDFNEFRRKLAQAAPAAQVAAAERNVSGSVTAQVQDKKTTAALPDKLTLAKGGAQATSNEAQIAKDRQAKDAASRTAELAKNIQELAKISAAASSSAAPGTVPSASAAKGIAVLVNPSNVASAAKPPATTSIASTATTALAAASSPISTATALASPAQASAATNSATPAKTTSASSASPVSLTGSAAAPVAAIAKAASAPVKPKTAAVAPPPPPETSLIDGLLEDPILPIGGVAIIGLLAGFGIYRSRKHKKSDQIDSSFLESRLQPDSFFGASGGQRVNTSDSSATGSSMVYSPSQLDAVGDVDPVAEADVYLAYGRDLQAEEILKEALRTSPGRAAIHGKLLQIYAKRGDVKGFSQLANEAYKLTQGRGAEWNQICVLGNEIDPGNPQYQPGGDPVGSADSAAAVTQSFAASTSPQPIEPSYAAPAGSVDLDFDLDLDFSIGDDATSQVATHAVDTTPALLEPVSSMAALIDEAPMLDIDFGNNTMALNTSAESTQPIAPALQASNNGLSFTPEPLSFSPPPAPTVTQAPANNFDMMEFDLDALSLDLGGNTELPATPEASVVSQVTRTDAQDPLATKLALAEEFHAIGDPDGARSLVEEVVAEANGPLKEKAQRFLAEIS